MGVWVRVRNVREFMEAPAQRTRRVPHRFNDRVSKKRCHWECCSRCGLVALKNEATARAIRDGCEEVDMQELRT